MPWGTPICGISAGAIGSLLLILNIDSATDAAHPNYTNPSHGTPETSLRLILDALSFSWMNWIGRGDRLGVSLSYLIKIPIAGKLHGVYRGDRVDLNLSDAQQSRRQSA